MSAVRLAMLTMVVGAITLAACSFDEYAQVEGIEENIDEYRTGCEIDSDRLMAGYLQYEANLFHFSIDDTEPTPTPEPASSTDISTRVLLERVWEHGCLTGRRDALGSEAASLAAIRDALALLEAQIEALEGAPGR